MLRKSRRRQDAKPAFPVWMITFSDLVTLLMTFFVMLVSMASMMDVYKRKDALGSVAGTFGTGTRHAVNVASSANRQDGSTGPVDIFRGLDALQQQVTETPDSDIRFESNKFIQRLSMSADVLFAPGSAELSPAGRTLLEKVRPFVNASAYPMGLAGHTGLALDENQNSAQAQNLLDYSWQLSLQRVLNVYRYFLASGIPAHKLRLEAFGKFRPKSTSDTADGRRLNRSVDLILDKRIGSWDAVEVALKAVEQPSRKNGEGFNFNGFIFRLDQFQNK